MGEWLVDETEHLAAVNQAMLWQGAQEILFEQVQA